MTNRPNIPEQVKDRVKVLLRDMALRVKAGDFDDDEDDEDE